MPVTILKKLLVAVIIPPVHVKCNANASLLSFCVLNCIVQTKPL